MKTKNQASFYGAVALMALAWTHTAHAGQGIAHANSQVRLGYAGNTQFESTKRYEDGYHVSAKDGAQHGLFVGVSSQNSALGIANLYVATELTYLTGDNDYDGYGENAQGKMVPLHYKNDYDYEALDFAVKLGKGLPVGPHAQVTPYVTAGYSWWQRDSEKSGGYLDELSNKFYGAGAMVQYEFAPRWVLTVDGSYARNSGSQTDWVRDGVSYQHANKNTKQWGVGVNYSPARRVSVFAKWQVTQREYGASAVDRQGWHEPAVHTKLQQLQLGMALNF